MQHCNFDGSNVVLNPPAGVDPSVIEPIFAYSGATKQATKDDPPVIVTCWKPSREELAEIERTGRVWLTVLGRKMPPVAITAFSPFTQ